MSDKIGLILGSGALRGAYGAGVASVLGRHIYFDHVYGASVGVFAATFLVSQQFDVILDVWRNHVCGSSLINFANILKRRSILDLEYLTDLFKQEPALLDLDKIAEEKGKLIHVLTCCESGKPVYLRPDPSIIFDSMRASSAVPFLRRPIAINGKYYKDATFSDPYPVKQAIKEGDDKIIVVSNSVDDKSFLSPFRFCLKMMGSQNPRDSGIRFAEDTSKNNPNIFIIKPSRQILRGHIDTNRDRINLLIDDGIKDAEKFLEKFLKS